VIGAGGRRFRDRPLSTFIGASSLGRGDTFELALAAEICLKLGKYTKHVEEGLAGCGAGIDRLLSCLQRDPTLRSSLTMS
jgi:hypothetical protein